VSYLIPLKVTCFQWLLHDFFNHCFFLLFLTEYSSYQFPEMSTMLPVHTRDITTCAVACLSLRLTLMLMSVLIFVDYQCWGPYRLSQECCQSTRLVSINQYKCHLYFQNFNILSLSLCLSLSLSHILWYRRFKYY
jgi:hypothetical protein